MATDAYGVPTEKKLIEAFEAYEDERVRNQVADREAGGHGDDRRSRHHVHRAVA